MTKETATYRGFHDKCPHCGSKNVVHITRVTGYFTVTSSWNKGKIAELKDRHKETNEAFIEK